MVSCFYFLHSFVCVVVQKLNRSKLHVVKMSNGNSGAPIPGTSSSISKNLEKVIGVNSRVTRLPSIRSPRDLTLGSAPSKRVFVPNIPARREKRNKHPEKKESPKKTEVPEDSNLKDKRSTHHPRFQREYVSVSGAIFGEGLSAAVPKKGNLTAVDVQSRVSTCKLKKETDGSSVKMKIKEDDVDDAYLSDNFINDDDEPGDENQTYPLIVPMNVPFTKSSDVAKFDQDGLPKSISKPKQEFQTTVKKESPSSETALSPPLDSLFRGLNLKSEDPPMIMFEFPAGCDLPSKQGEPSIDPESIQNKRMSLYDFPEGYIGKLQRMKSGRYRFLIDGVSFDVVSVPNHMHQEVIAIQKEENETCVTELGQIQHMFKCVPSVTRILS